MKIPTPCLAQYIVYYSSTFSHLIYFGVAVFHAYYWFVGNLHTRWAPTRLNFRYYLTLLVVIFPKSDDFNSIVISLSSAALTNWQSVELARCGMYRFMMLKEANLLKWPFYGKFLR